MDVTVPVGKFARGELPALCPRHGEPATGTYRTVAHASLSGAQVLLQVLLAMVPVGFLVGLALKRARRQRPVWGTLSRCRQCRRSRRSILSALAVVWIGLFVEMGAVATATNAWAFPVWFLTVVLATASTIRAYVRTPIGLRVLLEEDRTHVTIKGVCDTFVDALPALG